MSEISVSTGGIYTASRTRHAAKWQDARRSGIRIISTWIDEAGEGESVSMVDLWRRCVDEARTATTLVIYREDEEALKGALIEAGAVLGAGKPVFAVGFNNSGDMKTFSFLYYPMVIRCESLETAFSFAGGLISE